MRGMTQAIDPRLRRDLRASVADGASYSLMVGLGETYLPAFAIAVGLGQVAAGLVAAVPVVLGAVIQLISPYAVQRLGSLRRWVVLCAATQALSFVPLLLTALGWLPAVQSSAWTAAAVVYSTATLYWAAGMGTGPAWNTWMNRLIPARRRATFFARRSRFTHGCVLVGLVAGGLALHATAHGRHELATFGAIFAAAAVFRLLSARFLAMQSEPRQDLDNHRHVPPGELMQRTRHRADGRLLAYLLAIQLATYVAAPYFTPYMLKQLHQSYAQYMLLTAVSYVVKVASAPLAGRIAAHFGARRLLWLGGLAVIPLPWLWTLGDSPAYLAFLQVLAGLAWGAHELAALLLFFETIPEEERTSVLTTYNLLNAVAQVAGALLGGGLLHWLHESHAGYMVLFATSTLGRALTVVLLARVTLEQPHPTPLATGSIAVEPAGGSIERPILASIAQEASETREAP